MIGDIPRDGVQGSLQDPGILETPHQRPVDDVYLLYKPTPYNYFRSQHR